MQYKPAPRGSKQCPNDCNKVGNCNYDTGLCECPAGEDKAPVRLVVPAFHKSGFMNHDNGFESSPFVSFICDRIDPMLQDGLE